MVGLRWTAFLGIVVIVATLLAVISRFPANKELSPANKDASFPPMPQPEWGPLPGSSVTPAPQPPQAQPQHQSPLDSALKSLVQGHIAFNNPGQMHVGETGQVEAILAVGISAEELMNALRAAGKHESDALLVSERMQATLAGGGAFDVSPAGPQTQWISKDVPTTWHWLVTPKLTGFQFLTLTVDAILTINGEKDTRNITTFTRQVDVEISRPHGVEEWISRVKQWGEDFGWGWVAIGAVIATVAGSWRRLMDWTRERRRRSDASVDTENDDC